MTDVMEQVIAVPLGPDAPAQILEGGTIFNLDVQEARLLQRRQFLEQVAFDLKDIEGQPVLRLILGSWTRQYDEQIERRLEPGAARGIGSATRQAHHVGIRRKGQI